MWASAPTEVCCGRHRLAKMLRRGGACPRPRAAIKAAPTSGVLSPAGYLAALGRRGGPMWASAPTEVCCGRHCPAKMLCRGGACPRPRAATRAAPTSGVPSLAGYLAVLEACRGGCPHPPAGRSAGQGPRVRRYAVRGGAFISRGGNQNGKLYTALSPAPVGAGGQLSPHGLQRKYSRPLTPRCWGLSGTNAAQPSGGTQGMGS